MKKILIILVFASMSCITIDARAQTLDPEIYKKIKDYHSLIGVKIDVASEKELEEKIVIRELVEGLNSNQISMYSFSSEGTGAPFDIIVVENDSVEIYEIEIINTLLRRVIDMSLKYSDVSTNKKDIKWIDEILRLNQQALHEAHHDDWVTEVRRGKYTYMVRLEMLKHSLHK
jgi:hypothetical protein